MTWRRRETGVATLGVLAGLAVTAAISLRTSAPAWPTAVARLQPFADTIVEPGTIGAQRLMVYGSTIAGAAAKIVELAPEGLSVRAGDVLLRFDTTAFEQARERDRAALRQADADLVRVREDARVELLRSIDDVEASEQQIAKAAQAVTNEREGRGKVEVAAAETAAADAARELAQARATHEDMKPLLAEGFITRAELDRASQALEHAVDQQRLAAARLESLVTYERPAAASRAAAELNIARSGLARETEAISARTTVRRAAIDVAAGRIAEIKARLAALDDQIARATVRAQGPGLVVYRDLYFGNEKRKPQLGDEVYSNQPVMTLPDSTQLTVETRVREIDLHKVSASQQVEVRVEAYPDIRLRASVALVGALAQEDPARASTKFFPLTVKLASSDARLRIGMTAAVQIVVASLPSAIVVPVEAVFDDHGSRYVVIVRNGVPVRQTVTLAAQNESVAAIAAGLKSGDTILLVDPTAAVERR